MRGSSLSEFGGRGDKSYRTFFFPEERGLLVLRETQASARQRAGEKGMLAVANGTCPRGDWAGKTRE